jgi:hypothetical protein
MHVASLFIQCEIFINIIIIIIIIILRHLQTKVSTIILYVILQLDASAHQVNKI